MMPIGKQWGIKNIGVVVDSKLKFDKHIAEKVKKENWIVGIIKWNVKFLDEKKLWFFINHWWDHIWNMQKWSGLQAIENVQKRATSLITKIKHLSYEDRLRHLGLPTLAYRRTRGRTW